MQVSAAQPEASIVRTFARRSRLVAALPHGAVVAEVGVERGDFSHKIVKRTRPARLHLIDCWDEYHDDLPYAHDGFPCTQQDHESNHQYVTRRFAAEIRRGQVQLHRGYSVPVLATFPDGYFDWVYVDANHSYDAVAADLAAVLPKMKPGGVITGHDFINTPFWRNRNFGVVEAVHDFCAEHGWELVARTPGPGWDVDGSDNPSFAIRRIGLPPLWCWWHKVLPLPARRAA